VSRGQHDIRTVAGLTDAVRELCIEKGWRDQPGYPAPREGAWFPAYVALAHSELSEALEAYRMRDWSSTRDLVRPWETIGKPMGVGPEMADVLIRVIDMVDLWDISILYETERVLQYGWTRPYQHGGKVL
jgi:hypothetical protein